jgi:uncharacterized membrane protein YqjE
METHFPDMEPSNSRIARERVMADMRALARDAESLLKATADDVSEKAKEARTRLMSAVEKAKATYDEVQAQGIDPRPSLRITRRRLRDRGVARRAPSAEVGSMSEGEHGGGGVLDSTRRIAGSVLGLLQNRLSLAAVEWQEEKLRAVSLLVWLFVAIVLAGMGVLVGIATLALFLWERAGYAGLVGLALAALAGGFVMFLALRRRILRGPKPFAVTIEEFQKDLECLRPPP